MQTVSITFFNLKKHPAILFKQGSRGLVLTDLTDTDKSYRYSIQPCADSNQISHLSILPFGHDAQTGFLLKKGNLVRFMDKQLLIVHQPIYDQIVSPKLQADYLFITGSPHADMELINKCFDYHLLVADADNSDREIALLKAGTARSGKKINVLKRNKSLIIESD